MREKMKKFAEIQGLSEFPLFRGISEEELPVLLSCLQAGSRRFAKGGYVLRAGEETKTLFVLLSGTAFIVQEDFWGNRNLLATIRRGQSFAESFACMEGRPLTVSVLAETDCEIMSLDVRRILAVCRAACGCHSRMLRNLLSELAAKNLFYNEKMMHMSQRTTRAKLLSYFSSAAQENGSDSFEIPFSRQQLADYLSVERSGLSAELSRMQKEGILCYHKNRFVLFREEGKKNGTVCTKATQDGMNETLTRC